jgi:hypothetical protein
MRSKCRQCTRSITLGAVYCPHCGAVHRLSRGQAAVWLGQRALLGAIAGAIFGAVVMALVAVVLNGGLSGPFKTITVLARLGGVCGAMLGATLKAVYSWNRRQ